MKLTTLLLQAGLLYGLSGQLAPQEPRPAMITTPFLTITEHIEPLSKPTTAPLATYTLEAYKLRPNNTQSKARPAGKVEIREQSIYAELVAGIYTLYYAQVNDSTFIAQQQTKILWFHHIETYTETKTDSTRLINITSNKEVKQRRIAYLNKAHANEYIPLVELIKQFLNNTNPSLAKTVLMGEPFQLPLHETTTKNTTITKANVGGILKQEGAVNVILENPLTLYSHIDQGRKIPYHAEGKAIISNAPKVFSFLNGNWHITATREQTLK
jgi:hypothetical protein